MGLSRRAGERGSGFDRIAQAYRWLEYLAFGRALERCRCFYLDAVDRRAGSALVLGDGDGRFTERLLSARPALRVVAVDSSAAMLALLAGRAKAVGAPDRLETIERDALGFCADEAARAPEAGARFDLVVSHFFLDCLSTVEVQRLAGLLASRVSPRARWFVSEFATPSPWARLVVALLYRGFALLAGLEARQLPLWQAALSSAGWEPVAEQSFRRGLLVTTVWRLAPPAPGTL